MNTRLSDHAFYQYIKCPMWLYVDLHGSDPRPHDPLLAKLMQDGMVDEKIRELISDRKDLVVITAEDPEEAHRQTLEAMREGRQTIYGGALIDKHWVGYPDILERVEGRSKLGDYYYVAADVKRSRIIRNEYKLQGCFYAELLERIQHTHPNQGYIITPDKEVLGYVLEDVMTEYKLTLNEIEKIAAGKRPALFLSSGAKHSPWFEEHKEEAETCNHLSLLNRVWHEEVLRLEAAGVKTVSELAHKSVADLEAIAPDVSPHRLEILRDQALALHENRFMIRHDIDLPDAPVELYFDIESDPLRDFDYLFGVLVVSDEGETYHEFFAERPEDEAKMWDAFVEFIEQHIDAPIYHYGWFEQEVVHRFGAKYGVSKIALEAFERNMIDLIDLLRPAVIFPLSFYSLKDIAVYMGFSWRSKDASGANSVLWFEKWLETKDPALRKKIVEYNEDDVRATWKVREWIGKHAQY